MRRLLLGICLACSIAANSGCHCPCSHWLGFSPCGPGCGGCGSCGGGCGDCCDDCGSCGDCGGGCRRIPPYDGCPDCSACTPWGCKFGRPGGCGEFYWGDWCTGNPHCQTCDNCGNWVGPDSPGGQGQPPNMYSKAHPYGNQVVSNDTKPVGPVRQLARRMNERRNGGPQAAQMARRQAPMNHQQGPAPQMAQRDARPAEQAPAPQADQQGAPQVAQQATPAEHVEPPQPEVAPAAGPATAQRQQPVMNANARGPQPSQRVSPVQYRNYPQPVFNGRPAPNRYGQPQPMQRQRPNPYGADDRVVMRQAPQMSQQQMMQAQPQMSQPRPQMSQRRPQPSQQYSHQQYPQQQYQQQRPQQTGRPLGMPPQGQVARNGNQREYEGATEYIGTTDRIVSPAELPQQSARRGQQPQSDSQDAQLEYVEQAQRPSQDRQPRRR